MGLLLAFIAGLFAPLTNLTVRKAVDIGGNAKGYFFVQLTASFIFAALAGPLWKGEFSVPLNIAILGVIAGLILSLLFFSLGKAVEKGPSGLTFAILYSATVMPGLVMAIAFGARFGFIYTVWHAIGSILVLIGLFWAGKGLKGMKNLKLWTLFATAVFLSHILLLTFFQWRAMLVNLPNPEEFVSFFTALELQSEWFIPFMFLTCSVVQAIIYFQSRPPKLQRGVLLYGVAGGLSNFLCTLCVIGATLYATPIQNAVIFPIYSVVGIVLTNAWAQQLYHEKINWWACAVSGFGLAIGTIDWQAISH